MLSAISFAYIPFSNGKWETTFDCPEWEGPTDDISNCDGLVRGGIATATCEGGERGSQITEPANYSGGGGGKGFRMWVGDGTNDESTKVTARFPSPQKELWIRWYHRYEEGFTWAMMGYDKILRINTNDVPNAIPRYAWSNSLGIYAEGGSGGPSDSSSGWQYVQGGTTGDGQFHCHEIHMRMDTDGTDGVGRYWIDGELRMEKLNVNWSGNRRLVQNEGWTLVIIGGNQNEPGNGRCMYVDYDDMVIYNQTPPNTDAHGNPFIGPLSTASPWGLIIDVQ